jgi:tRNA modification GTPase
MVSDAILAIATAPGRGGIGVIRISLPDRLLAGTNALAAFCQSAFELQPKPRFAHFCSLHDIDGKPLDDGILLYFPAPASFTGEHVLEFQGHGGPALLNMAVRQLLTLGGGFGLRLAKPGEFTQRAFLNGLGPGRGSRRSDRRFIYQSGSGSTGFIARLVFKAG